MKVVQVVPHVGEESSGPSYTVPGLCCGLMSAGCAVELHYGGQMLQKSFGFPAFAYPVSRFPVPQLGRSAAMKHALCAAAATADVVHNNSLWMCPNVYPYLACKRHRKCKLVNAPRGTLAPWALKRHPLQKRLFGAFGGQYAAMCATDMWHATCEKEYKEIRAAGFRQPVAIVPVGMDIPEVKRPVRAANGKRTLVFFGRIHEVKGLDRLVNAWGNVADRHPDWELVVAGPDCGGKEPVEQIVAERKIPRVSFVGELRGEAKYEFLASADLYALPSHTENFAVTVAEALACGTPCIASTGTPWHGLVEKCAGWWVENSVEGLTAALETALSLGDDEREAMGRRGMRWIEDEFSWISVGQRMRAAYEWLLGRGDRPVCVCGD